MTTHPLLCDCNSCQGGCTWRTWNACKVCGAEPDADGVRDHGRGCYVVSGDGGGSDSVELCECAKCEAIRDSVYSPATLAARANVERQVAEARNALVPPDEVLRAQNQRLRFLLRELTQADAEFETQYERLRREYAPHEAQVALWRKTRAHREAAAWLEENTNGE